jgi:hypothetical protein
MNENSSVNELLAATMEPPSAPLENQFAKVDPATGETICTKIPLGYHKLDDNAYAFGNRNLTDDLKSKGKTSAYNNNQEDGLCIVKASYPGGEWARDDHFLINLPGNSWLNTSVYSNEDTGEIERPMKMQWLDKSQCADPNLSPRRQWGRPDMRWCQWGGADKRVGLQATIENFIQNSGIEIVAKSYNPDHPLGYETIE